MEPWHNLNRLEQVIGRGVKSGTNAYGSSPERETPQSIYILG